MIQTNDPSKCCGCLVCSVVCSQKCIVPIEDAAGFVMPKVDVSKCVHCGMCEKECPIQKTYPMPDFTNKSVYGGYSKDADLRSRASSGGMFETVAQLALAQGGSVFGCKFNENLQLCMQEATTIDEVQKLTKSKYIQSRCHDMFPIIKQRIEQQKQVLVCATPCQIAALKNYLGSLSKMQNLFLMDFICHGVPSQELFDKNRTYIERKLNGCLKDYKFRCKPSHPTTLHYVCYQYQKDKKSFQKTSFFFEDPFYLGFLKYITLRDSCYQCPFGKGNHQGDITVGDLHEAETYWPEVNRYDGVSKVIINTQKGQELWQQMKLSFHVHQLPQELACLSGPTSMPPKRNDFIEDLKKLPFEQVINKWLNPRKEWKKVIYYRLPDLIRIPMKKVCLTIRDFVVRRKK